ATSPSTALRFRMAPSIPRPAATGYGSGCRTPVAMKHLLATVLQPFPLPRPVRRIDRTYRPPGPAPLRVPSPGVLQVPACGSIRKTFSSAGEVAPMADVPDRKPERSLAPPPGLGGLVVRFAAAWRSGRRPVLDDYLPAGSEARRAALIDLAHAD